MNSAAAGRLLFCRFLLRPTVPEHKLRDDTVDRIYELTDRLQERLADAERIRARYSRAHERNQWPDLDGAVARLVSNPEPPKH